MRQNSSDFDQLERELRMTLRRVEAPEGFMGSVLLQAETRRKVLSFSGRRQAWIGCVAASLLVVLLVGGVEHRRAEERVKAGSDFARSLEITDRAMDLTRERLQKVGVVVD